MTDEPKDWKKLEEKIGTVKRTLASLIAWMAGSANSPISQSEARMLLEKLEGYRDED